MARPISDEELQLRRRARRRLIGAIVLVTAFVVALPMVLDSEPRPIRGEMSIKIPPPDSKEFTSRIVPEPPSAAPRQPPSAAARDKGAPATPKFSAAIGERPPAASSQPDATPAPSTAEGKGADDKGAPGGTAVPPAPSSAPADGHDAAFAVQVVALADAEKVKQVREKIASAGLKSYTETVKTAKGEVTRVRTGPYANRAAAEKAREQLKAIGLPGNIVTK